MREPEVARATHNIMAYDRFEDEHSKLHEGSDSLSKQLDGYPAG